MTWIKVDDSFGDHPKVMALGRDRMAGLGVWTAASCYCARHLTDGFVPAAVAEGFGHARIIGKLVDVGLFDKVPGGYQLHDWLDYNPPRTKVLKDRPDLVPLNRMTIADTFGTWRLALWDEDQRRMVTFAAAAQR